MAKIIQVKTAEDGQGYFDVSEFSDSYDIDKIVYYTFEEEGGALILRFFDANEELLLPTKE